MKFVAISVKDLAAGTFGPPFFVPNAGVGMRSFANEVNRVDEKNAMFTNPGDFELYQLGTFDDELGLLSREERDGVPSPKMLARASEVKRVMN